MTVPNNWEEVARSEDIKKIYKLIERMDQQIKELRGEGLCVTTSDDGSMTCCTCGVKIVNTTKWKTAHLASHKVKLTKLQSPESK